MENDDGKVSGLGNWDKSHGKGGVRRRNQV